MAVDRERLRRDIEANATFGAIEGVDHGRTLLTGSPADEGARDRLVDRLEAAGLSVRVDSVGNIAGRWVPDGVDPATPPVALGSHLDSVPEGGIFDGPLGVYGALEAVRAVKGSERDPSRPLEVVCFTEEEGGRFGVGTLGSSVAAGELSTSEALGLEDDEGVTLAARLADIGYDGTDRLDPAGWAAWLELHIEQGTRLEAADAGVGLVEAIAGLTNCEVVVEGQADHAGTTSMAARRDPLPAAAECVLAVEEAARDLAGSDGGVVGTVGRLSVEPNVRNVVPGRVACQLDVRASEPETMDRIVDRTRGSLDRLAETRPVEPSLERYRTVPPTPLDDGILETAADAASACDVRTRRLTSGAIHDTANVARQTDAGLLFAPSRDGVSHSPREWTDWADCATATRVLARAAGDLAGATG